MIGNPKWFSVRKYSGWGLSPNCWQGWAYIFAFVAPVGLISSVPIDQNIKNIFVTVWTALLIIDVVHIMSQIKKDERELLHEAIADRNALWFMIFALLVGIFIKQIVDPVVIAALLGATVVKAITYFYLRDK